MMKFLLLFFTSTIIFWALACPARASSREIPNIIILTLNGVREEESTADPHKQYMRHLFTELVHEGFLFTNLIEENYELHMPAVKAINFGKAFLAPQKKSPSPSILQYAVKDLGMPRDKAWSIGHWAVSDIIGFNPDYPEDTWPRKVAWKFTEGSDLEDEELFRGMDLFAERSIMTDYLLIEKSMPGVFVWPNWDTQSRMIHNVCLKILRRFKPSIMHYVVAIPETGHHGIYAQYITSIMESDRQIHDIWRIIQEYPEYRGNTYLFICPDGQRDAYYMQHTESFVEYPRATWLYVYGPGITKDKSSAEELFHKDIFGAIGHILGLPGTEEKGKLLGICMEEPDQPPKE